MRLTQLLWNWLCFGLSKYLSFPHYWNDSLDVQIMYFFPQTECDSCISDQNLFICVLPRIYNFEEGDIILTSHLIQPITAICLAVNHHHVLTHSVSSRSLPLGLTRTSPSPTRLGAHPCILFLSLSPFIHLSIYIERSPLLLLWVVGLAVNLVIFAFQILYIYSLKLVFNSHLELTECSFWTLFVHLRFILNV